jgi:hypothetical protein
MLKVLAIFITLTTSAFAHDACQNSFRSMQDQTAFTVVAKNMKYTVDELCSLPRLLAVYMDNRTFYRPENNNQPEPHTWVTLHYNEYSCQYFVRDADLVVTKSNCYNTF